MKFWKPSGRASCSGREARSITTSPATASAVITLSRSRVRRAGNTFTRSSVTADPAAAGISRNGATAATAIPTNPHPASKAAPYAASTGTSSNATIQLECSAVSASRAR